VRPIAAQQPVPIEIVVRSEPEDADSSVEGAEHVDGGDERALDDHFNGGGAA
jgi:hypothetical protein